jgi:hypothetical protein
MTPCSLVEVYWYRVFCCLHHQGRWISCAKPFVDTALPRLNQCSASIYPREGHCQIRFCPWDIAHSVLDFPCLLVRVLHGRPVAAAVRGRDLPSKEVQIMLHSSKAGPYFVTTRTQLLWCQNHLHVCCPKSLRDIMMRVVISWSVLSLLHGGCISHLVSFSLTQT